MIALITLNPALDRILYMPHLMVGAGNRAERLTVLPGGKGINIAVILNHFGHDTIVSGFLGGLAGEFIEGSLRSQGISVAFQPILENTRSNVIVIERDGRTTLVLEPGPTISAAEVDRFLAAYEETISARDTVVFAGSLPPGVPEDIYANMISIAKAKGVFTVLNTRGAAFEAGVRAGPDLVKPDMRLDAEILGINSATPSGRRELADRLFDLGVKTVTISFRHFNHAIYTEGEAFELTIERPAASSVVAGDAFLGGYIDAIKRDRSPVDAAIWGMSAGLAVRMNPEKRWATEKELETLAGEIRKKPIRRN